MVETRGGLQSIQSSNQTLYFSIHWFVLTPQLKVKIQEMLTANRYDYSSSCNLLSKRQLVVPTKETSRLSTNPTGVLPTMLQCLPFGYDLHLTISTLFLNMQSLTSQIYANASAFPGSSPSSPGSASSTSLQSYASSPSSLLQLSPPDEAQNFDCVDFLNEIDSSLYTSYITPDTSGNRSRRRHILESYQSLVLIYTTFISQSPPLSNSLSELFMLRLSNILVIKAPEWGSSIIDLFRLLSPGCARRPSYSETSSYDDNSWYEIEIKKVIDASDTLGWEIWQSIKVALFNFFITDEGCKSQQQTLWKRRVEMMTEERGR
jgi:hypothetical protein